MLTLQIQPSTYYQSLFKTNSVGGTGVTNNLMLAQPIQASLLSPDSVTVSQPAEHHPPVTQRQSKLQHHSDTNCTRGFTSHLHSKN